MCRSGYVHMHAVLVLGALSLLTEAISRYAMSGTGLGRMALRIVLY